MNYGRYHVVEKLGEGTSGTLYKALDPIIDRHIALKVLHEYHVKSDEFLNRFIKEAKAVGRLSHGGIVTVYDVGEDHGTVYIAMELVEGMPLDVAIKEDPLSLKEVVNFGIEVARALEVAHNEGIIHRDIKPPNILFSTGRKVKITDFGIAHIDDSLSAEKTQIGTVLGTPLYMSPEQVNAGKVDGRSDLYSLGIILYELVAGSCPFKGADLTSLFSAIIQGGATPLEAEDDSLTTTQAHQLFAVIMKSIAKNPEDRFQTADAMATALNGCLQEVVVDTDAGKEELPRSKKPLVLGAGVFFVVVLFFAIYSFWPVPKQMLILESEPAGARVYINSSFAGETPLHLKLPVDKYEVKFNMEKYYEWEAQIQLTQGKDASVLIPLMLIDEP